MFLLDLCYFIGALFAAPFIALKSRRTGKYRSGWSARLGTGPDLPRRALGEKRLLLHCVSVGELNSVQTLVEKLLAADEHLHIIITTTTDTGTARAEKLYPAAAHPRVHRARFPLDFSFAVERLFDRLQPDGVALVELETWPHFLAIAESRRVPVLLINGRLSEKSFPRYRLIRPIMRSMLRKLAWIAVQTPTYAARFAALGATPDQLEVLPTLKYDNAQFADSIDGQAALAAAMGLAADHQLIVAGSTGPGEEEPLLDAYLNLREKFPRARLAIVPRHPEVVPQVIAAIQRRQLTPILRSNRPDTVLNTPHPALAPADVFILNTMGELRKLYALAFAIFVGRSLIKSGGSDMIEAAALGKPVCYGPHTGNFAEVVELLTRHHAAVTVYDAGTLTDTLAAWLADPSAAQALGSQARELIRQQQGSTARYVLRILNVLNNKR